MLEEREETKCDVGGKGGQVRRGSTGLWSKQS